MKAIIYILLCVASCVVSFSQESESDAIQRRLVIGKKEPGDGESLRRLGVESIDFFLSHLQSKLDDNDVPRAVYLITVKYDQFKSSLTTQRKDHILDCVAVRVMEIEDVPSKAYLIQASMYNLEGFDHPKIRALIDRYANSKVEGTRLTAERLKKSLDDNLEKRQFNVPVTQESQKQDKTTVEMPPKAIDIPQLDPVVSQTEKAQSSPNSVQQTAVVTKTEEKGISWWAIGGGFAFVIAAATWLIRLTNKPRK